MIHIWRHLVESRLNRVKNDKLLCKLIVNKSTAYEGLEIDFVFDKDSAF